MTDYIISVKPKWANAFFSTVNPKLIELRKGIFGASLKPRDNLVIYSTLPEGCAIGTVKVARRSNVFLADLWEQTEQGKLALVTKAEFDSYYSESIVGAAIWVTEPEKWERPISLAELREILGKRWQPPQQIAKVNVNLLQYISMYIDPSKTYEFCQARTLKF